MIEFREDERFIKVTNSVMALKECKSGRFTSFRKLLLSKLIYMVKRLGIIN
jgi:hypothetical protein